ncbi:pesticidal protein Cry28Aa [Subsaximicrobium wynnwilliamsii]|uniref:Pesticidal protein Cry28Aa n=1 Tax=Subsaximicrobium wynnwilliamsii TaxID=291179 RepID=A0A5C6ZL59_9FLAO|nr:proton-conducting transporter membrane subunit [Subsaximicrobium wynnwilliamsii]TXD84446.1 pesticidal protein Cry28Aa [Subsaximicrobium wynnwilliamsii]TXD90127.1 pesticidal protein Cry28Aa [Subsaximicrobium wynnwilliamsii]TXE04179.1 pesticidal protein Cry28Aa [Subsaximicrobium wynnwilliamsii]
MTLENHLDSMHPQSTKSDPIDTRKPMVSRFVTLLLWLLFLGNLAFLTLNFFNMPEWSWKSLFRINGFTILIWTTVTFFSAIIGSYAGNYLSGFKFHSRFMMLCLGFTLSVMLLVMSNHVVLLIFSWLIMGIFMSQLIGIDKTWGEAREASKFTQKYFLIGTLFLTIGLLLLAFYSKTFTISGLSTVVSELPLYILIPSALCIISAAVVQSAMYPFHRWLLSAMTAPTPASALMHAGFVNGAGILLALFATLLFASNTLTILFIIGGLTAIIAQFTKLLQVNVKQKLACSTIAQMGFMIMQCGLGFFNAAVAHLILHGFYKAYLFLSSGEEIAQTTPEKHVQLKIKPLQALAVLLFGGLGAYLFAIWTGKGLEMDSGVFLTLIVAITVGQATYNMVKEQSLSLVQKILVPAVLFVAGIGIYALMYNGVSILMLDMPMVAQPIPLTWVQITFGIIFLLGFFIMKLGVYKKLPWLYVKLMNISQPYKNSVLMYKSKSI